MPFKYTSVNTNVCTSYDNDDGSIFFIWQPDVSSLSEKEIDAYEKMHYYKNNMMDNTQGPDDGRILRTLPHTYDGIPKEVIEFFEKEEHSKYGMVKGEELSITEELKLKKNSCANLYLPSRDL